MEQSEQRLQINHLRRSMQGTKSHILEQAGTILANQPLALFDSGMLPLGCSTVAC
jgi:hypothetical protein